MERPFSFMERAARVGLTGGIGAGKSEVARRFEERGATVIDADLLAREVVAPGTPGLTAIAVRWPEVIDPAGALDRAALARRVFADEAAREALNAIVHPRVRELADERERTVALGAIALHVVPLLFEGDFWKRCDLTVVVTAPRELRIDRVLARDATTREAVEARIAAQIDPGEARLRASFTIENDGDREQLRRRADAVYDEILAALEMMR